jgi:adenylosuccinate synthase
MAKCTIVVGGQYGSEGKGKTVALLARAGAPVVVRCGGPNSGHTTSVNGRDLIVRQLPAGISNPASLLLIAAGCVVDERLLRDEVAFLGITRDRLVVDPRAVLLTPEDRLREASNVSAIGSTASGTGAALMRRMGRSTDVRLAEHSKSLREFARVESTAALVHDALQKNRDVIVEGTQGFALSLFHGPVFPFVTARDTTAAGFCSEVGVSPRQVTDVVVVIRTFPIRVGGNSGPLPDEISWETIREESRAPIVEREFTSVTRRLRRVARFDLTSVVNACRYNAPTRLAVMGVDRLDYDNRGIESPADLSDVAMRWIDNLQRSTEVRVGFVGTGFSTYEAVNMDDSKEKISNRDEHAIAITSRT